MKKLLSIAMSVFILLPTITMTASAITDSNGTGPATTAKTEDKTTAQTTKTETETEADKKARLARLEDDKKKFAQTALTEALKKRIGERCVSAQGLVKTHRDAETPIADKYSTAYDKITAKLDETAAKLKAENIDTTTLDANIATLKTKVAVFKTAVAAFQQALKDLNALDCKTDPAGFKAALEATRADQQAVVSASKDVHSFLKDTVKVTLQALKEKEDKTTN